jgi:hypothetical protein
LGRFGRTATKEGVERDNRSATQHSSSLIRRRLEPRWLVAGPFHPKPRALSVRLLAHYLRLEPEARRACL